VLTRAAGSREEDRHGGCTTAGVIQTQTPRVSIIVPTYLATTKQADLLDETLGTVDAQDIDDHELIVVDDGSRLPAAPIVARHRNATTIRRANGGSAHARNAGIAAARGETLVFLDGDDHLLPGALAAGLHQLEQHPECGFVVGGREEMTFEGEPVPWSVAQPPSISYLFYTLLAFDWYIIPPSSAMFRRAVVDAIGGFRDPWGADDLDFYLRVAHRFEGFCYASPAVTRYRRYSASSSRDGARMLRSIRAVYERQRPIVKGDAAGEAAFARGISQLEAIFKDCLVENVVDRLRASDWGRAVRYAATLLLESPSRLATALRLARMSNT
jgi:glycosyltransferase involved in cell wall biosynthesis